MVIKNVVNGGVKRHAIYKDPNCDPQPELIDLFTFRNNKYVGGKSYNGTNFVFHYSAESAENLSYCLFPAIVAAKSYA